MVNFLIQPELIKQIENYLYENYDLENHEIVGERGKTRTFFEEIEILLKQIFGKFDGLFLWHIYRLMKKKNLTESQVIKKTNLHEDFFSILRDNEYVNISREVVLALSTTLQADFKEMNKLLDLAGCRNLYFDEKRDVIIAFFIENKIDDVFLLNETLEYFNVRNLHGKKIFPDEVKILIEPIDKYVEKNFVYPIKFSYSGNYHKNKIDKVIAEKKINFFDYLRELIQEKNLSEVEVYKKAHLDRRIFSKLRNEKSYKPSKETILAISFGMELNLAEVEKLLKCGGYALSDGDKFDLIMRYFFENEIYDLSKSGVIPPALAVGI